MPAKRPRLFVISGPSGAGKGTLVARVRDRVPNLCLTVSATTRAPRAGEADGIDYHFIDDERFDCLVAADEFLEWANVHGHRYGTLRSEVDRCRDAGRSVVLEIDVQGALNVRGAYKDAVLVFIEPPSLEELERRLRSRGTDDEGSIATRLANARQELALADVYDERIINDDVDRAAHELMLLMERYETDGGRTDGRDQAGD